MSGRLADLLGRRNILTGGLALFAVCALVDALAANVGLLIAARAFQGIGAAAAIPAALGILTSTFTEQAARSRAIAAFGAAGAVGFASGLVLGGAVTGPFGWRWVFVLTAGLAAVLLLAIYWFVPRDEQPIRSGRVDMVGALTATTGLLGLVFALTSSTTAGWTSPSTLVALVTGLGLLGVFLVVQARGTEPLMPFYLWRRPQFPAAMFIGFCNFGAWVGANYFLSLTLQNVLGYSPGRAAAALVPLAVGGWLFATLAGRLLPRLGAAPLVVTGLTVYLAGLTMLALLGRDTGYWPHVFIAVVLAVAGNATVFVASNVTALAHAGPDEQSLVGGLFNTSMQLGGGLGLAIMSVAAATQTDANATGDALLLGYQSAFWTAVGVAVLGLLLALPQLRTSRGSLGPGSR